LVLEAITRANGHPDTEGLFGRPISAGLLSRGYVWNDETGWSEGKIWIPVSGVKASGTIFARGGQANGPWVFSELTLRRDDGRAIDLLAPIVQPSLVPLPKHVQIYIVPLGGVQGLGLDELPEFYRSRYGISVRVVNPIPLDPKTRDPERRQLVFEELITLMHARLPRLAQEKSAFLVGITDEDMYMRDGNYNFVYTAFDTAARAGAVSSVRFIPYPLARNEALLRTRVRKMVSRVIGFGAFNFPRNDDPSSVLYRDLYGRAGADLMSDSIEGLGSRAVVDEFQTAHGSRPQPVEIPPSVANFDYAKVDGRYPCLQINKASHGKAEPVRINLTRCAHGTYINNEIDEIEIDLRSGSVITRTTDLFVPGTIPLAATRCYRSYDNRVRTFGRNTTLSWDLSPIGSRQPYTFIEVITCEGNALRYERISKGTDYADAVYEHRATATPFLGSRIRWNGNGWDLTLRDGSMYLFPESYYAKRPTDGALTEFRDANGQVVKMERRERRNLKRIASPHRGSITFEHDPSDRIISAQDDQNRKVNYFYDHGSRLVEVRGLQSVVRYTYANSYLMSVEENARRLVDFVYKDWRISELLLPNRRIYRFRYEYNPGDEKRVLKSFVTSPDGSVATFEIPPN
jgi:predicted Zn-dependent protease